MNKISHISLIVHNQQEAADFYTEKLGFVVIESHKAEDGTYLWLVIAPTQESPVVFTLMSPQNESDKALVGKQGGSMPFFILSTDDCYTSAEEFSAKGVEFIKQPTAEFWGVDAIFKDLYGNLIDLCQPTEH